MSETGTMRKYKRLVLLCTFALVLCRTVLAEDVKKENEDILFMDVPVVVTASLTEVNPRLVPAAVTTITDEQIQASGARSLFELLDIYVPNLQWWRNHWEADNMGLRGILSDRDDKYLILVNGRVMNERTHYGALSERDLPLLKDIYYIDVVRGPGSALYGPGAVAMVINIITHNAQTFEGTDITSRLGAVEEFYSTEIRHGQKFKDNDDGGIFTYAGIGKYNGANAGNAHQIYGVDFVKADGSNYDAGEPLSHPSINDGEDHRHLPPLKFHAQITKDDWDIWGRYTRGGKQIMWPTGTIAQPPYGWTGSWILPYSDSSYGYQQWTGFIGNTKELDGRTNLETSFSYDRFYFSRIIQTWLQESFREDKYLGRAIIRQEFNNQHKVAYGFEVLHGEYGFENTDSYADDAFDGAFNNLGGMPRWSTNLYSLLGEWQWKINDQWTTFLGARLDDHTYTSQMFSPRAALTHTPNEKDTYKLIWARSVRANYEEEMKKTDMTIGEDSDTEKLDSVELRYERQHNEHLDLAGSLFLHYNLELIGWSNDANGQTVVGTQKEWGFEVESSYHTSQTRLAISHAFTKLIDFQLADSDMVISDPSIQFSAKPYGFGNDLQRWANNITKIFTQYKLDENWTLDGSLRIYWDFPGLKDYAKYTAQRNGYSLESNSPFHGNYYLDLGLQYRAGENLTLRLDGYNLLGIFDENLNKRNYGGEGSADFRNHAAAVAVSAIYKF
jgi:outer membrane receptor protein involved in Fe transport